MAAHSSVLPGESHGWRKLVGYSPRGHRDRVSGAPMPYFRAACSDPHYINSLMQKKKKEKKKKKKKASDAQHIVSF